MFNCLILMLVMALHSTCLCEDLSNRHLVWEDEMLDDGAVKFRLRSQDGHLTFHTVLSLISSDINIRHNFVNKIAQFGTSAFFECVPISGRTLKSTMFEFVLLPAPQLELVSADISFFKSKFDNLEKNEDSFTDASVVAFDNLGGDAKLIVPLPLVDKSIAYGSYTHLSSFLRSDSVSMIQKTDLFKEIANVVLNIMNNSSGNDENKKLWISTSGLGVSWLHVRLDSRPKYYNYKPYKSA